MNNTVSIVRLDTYEEEQVRAAMKELLEPIGALDFVKPGMKIALKVNLVTAMKPESAATTHPALVRVLCRMITERGGEVIVGDSPGGPFTGVYMNRVYNASGISGVVMPGVTLNKNYGISVCQSNPGAAALRSFEYTSWLDRVDAIINFAKLKTHGMMSLSCAVKNMFGCIPGTTKPEYHYRFPNTRDFANMLIDIDEYFKPCLSIVDGVIGMEGNGPTMGTPRAIGALVASASPYACDRICAELIGLDEERVPTLAMARERGLCPERRDIPLVGTTEGLIVGDFKNIERMNSIEFLNDLAGLHGRIWGKIIKKAMCSRPDLEKKKCVGCKKCHDICPAKAIEMKDGRPSIARDKCIRCFCCQEFCPVGAMKVHRPVVARILNKL